MDGQIFSHSLMCLQGTDLRMVYALLCKTNIGHLVSSKTKDLFSKEEQDHFTRHLEHEVSMLQYRDDHELQVDLFLELTKLLHLRGTKYNLEQEVEDQCTDIVYRVYEQYKKQDKSFRTFTEGQSGSTPLQQMIHFQMGKIFQELDGGFQSFSIEDQTKFASQVKDYIQSLPEEKQSKIKERLGIDDLTDEVLRKTIAASGTSIVFALIVEISGFAFYTTATSLVAGFAGLFGLTLPFGFYTGLTSTIAVLANPLFLIPVLLGGGAFLVHHQNKALKTKLLPIIVMQIALPYMSSGAEVVPYDTFIAEWERRYDKYSDLHGDLRATEQKQSVSRERINQLNRQIGDCLSGILEGQREVRIGKERVKSALKSANLDALEISHNFSRYIEGYRAVQVKMMDLKRLKDQRPPVDAGFFSKIGSKFKGLATSLDIKEEEKKLDLLLNGMVKEVLLSTGSFGQIERESISRAEEQVRVLEAQRAKMETEREYEQKVLSGLDDEHRILSKNIRRLEKDNYGLADLELVAKG